jgi:hypothetical protein
MPDDTFNTLLQFTTDAGQTNKELKTTTENLKKMEEQAAKISKVEFKPVPADYVSGYQKAVNKTIEEAKRLGIKVREGLAQEAGLGAGGIFSAAANEFHDLLMKVERMKAEQEKLSRSQIVPPSATAEQLAAIDPGFIKRARELEEEGARIGTAFSKSFDQLIAGGYRAQQAIKRLENEIKNTSTAVSDNEKIDQKRAEEAKKRNREEILAISARTRLLQREASILNKQAADIKQNAGILRDQSAQLQGISQLALGLGTGVVGGIFAFATKYVNDAKEATEVTIAWKAAQASLAESGQRVGAVLAEAALPLLREAAETAEKASQFVEKHPEIVRAALNAGLVIAGLGAVGIAVSKGIKLYADQLYLSSIPLQLRAGELQFAAAHEQLTAAQLRAKAAGLDLAGGGGGGKGGSPVPGLGNVASTLGKVTLIASSVIIGAEIGNALGNAIAKLIDPNSKDMTTRETLFYGGVRAAEAIQQKSLQLQVTAAKFLSILPAGDKLIDSIATKLNEAYVVEDRFFQKLLLGFTDAEKAVEKAPVGVKGSPAFEQILKAYEDYKKNDLELVRRHYAERENIISSAFLAEQAANARYANDVNRIRTQSSHAISQATAAFHAQEQQAEVAFATQRAQTIRDGGIEIQRIEEQLQENLRKMRSDHEDRLVELVASRDALGIVKEQERYNKERAEAIQSTNAEIRQRRADLAVRLADQFQSYQNERTQRLADFQARLDEIRNNANEQLKELSARHQEELTQIRQQRNERIKELDAQFKEERKRRYDYFVDQIRQLDAGLIGEAELRKRRQAELIAELDRFLLQYNQKAGSIAQAQALSAVRAKGGYATYGTYLLGDKQGGGPGKREYVLSGDTTELAERVLGGQLSQNKLASLLSAMNGGSKNNVVYNDSRQISSDISNATREKLLDDTFSALTTALEG